MFKLLKFMKKYTLESILGPLFKLLEASFELFVPLVIARMVDVGIANSDTSYIVKMALVLGALGIIGLFFSVTAQYFAAKAAVGFTTELRSRLYRHIQTLSWQDLDSLTQSQLITLMTSDMNQIQTGINLSLRLLLRSPFVVFGAMIMAFTIDVKSALIFAVAIPVLAAVVFSVILSCIPLYKKVQKKLGKVLLSVRENLSGVRVVRAFCKEKGIHMESSWTPIYNSAYIEGIHNLYEFDCGELSGWMYRVNGWYPNYGCSRYQLKQGDVVEWRYTCDLGEDVGRSGSW